LKPEEVKAALAQELFDAAEKKATKVLNFSVTINEGGIRQVKIASERVLK
jgi:hypothetical protein